MSTVFFNLLQIYGGDQDHEFLLESLESLESMYFKFIMKKKLSDSFLVFLLLDG